MAQLKPTASLSSGLLARKGQARPAMRPQGLGFGTMNDALEDLGWNDMGQADEHASPPDLKPVLTPMHTATPMPTVLRQREALREEIEAPAEPETMPVDEAVAEAPEPITETPEPVVETPQPVAEAPRPVAVPATPRASVSVATAARIGRETSGKGKGKSGGRGNRNAAGKAAFTLRLDTDRHLRLRLASALCNRSAQVLVTEALDALLESLPEIDDLVSQLPQRN